MIRFFLIFSFLACSFSTFVFANSIFVGKADEKPLEVAIHFLKKSLPSGDAEGNEMTTIQQFRVFCKGQQACPLQSKIIFTIDGLNDDSIEKERYILTLQQNSDQIWEIIQQDISRICRKGRGQHRLSKMPCQ